MATTSRPSTTRRLVTIGGVLVVALVGAVVWYLTRPAPAAVDIDAAVDSVAGSSTATDEGTDDADDTAATSTTADGEWTVDTTIGEFSVLDTTGSFVGFRIAEELSTVGSTEAIGRTPDVDGTITIDGALLADATVTGDLTGIVSDESRRDDRIQSALETDQFPDATFALDGPVDLGAEPARDETITVDAPGTLTVHGVDQDVVVPLEAVWTDDVVVLTGSFDIALSDFDVEAPSAPIVVSVSDTATVELQLFLTRG